MFSSDKSGFRKFLLEFDAQITGSSAVLAESALKPLPKGINNILYLGMGGSGIAGHLLSDAMYDELTIPMQVINSYKIPAFCGKQTLVIASSYSGDTEEIIEAASAAAATGAYLLVIASGGKLARMARKESWPLLKIPAGFPPRQALGYLFFPIYHFIGQNGLIGNYQENLSDLVRFVKKAISLNDYPHVQGHVLSKELAQKIAGKIPIFYSTTPYLRTIGRRWQNQVQENAKSLAFSNVLPEMNHNEIMGWEQDSEKISDFIVVFLENENVHPSIQKRIDLSKRIINKQLVEAMDVYTSGENVLEKIFSMVVLGDWVSYYLAMAYKKDPSEIDNIDFLKKEMSKK